MTWPTSLGMARGAHGARRRVVQLADGSPAATALAKGAAAAAVDGDDPGGLGGWGWGWKGAVN